MTNYIIELLALLLTLSVLLVLLVRHKYSFWKKKNIPYLEPGFPLGNCTSIFPKGLFIGTQAREFYTEFKKRGCKIGGIYIGLTPNLIIVDPDIAKDILTKHFSSFMNRGIYKTNTHPITVNLFSQEDSEWRNARAKLSPLFTSSKIRNFFEIMKGCSEQMLASLEKTAVENTDVDIKHVLESFTINGIGSVIYGLECNCFENPNSEFARMGRITFGGFRFILGLFFVQTFPKLADKLGLSTVPSEMEEFLSRILVEIVKYRDENNIRGHDFMQMFIDMKNQGQLSMDEILGQTFLFFVAGLDTSASSASWTLFELAQNPEAQKRLRNEINTYTEQAGGKLNYEAVMKMEYLSAAFQETLRKWPTVVTLARTCKKDVTLEGSDITLPKDTTIIIPVLGYHHDPDYYPDPLKWDPERFLDKDVKHHGYLPFGEGPRMCIGMRYGQMQAKLAIAEVVKRFEISLSPSTILPLELERDAFILATKQKVYLKLNKLQ